MSARTAKNCFVENRNLFANVHGTHEQQEKWNLYNGLANLADSVDDLERQVAAIVQALRR
jgi:hypothetical protein